MWTRKRFIRGLCMTMTGKVNSWHALTAGVCNQSYYWQLIRRGWRPDFENNRAVAWTWRGMVDKTRFVWTRKVV